MSADDDLLDDDLLMGTYDCVEGFGSVLELLEDGDGDEGDTVNGALSQLLRRVDEEVTFDHRSPAAAVESSDDEGTSRSLHRPSPPRREVRGGSLFRKAAQRVMLGNRIVNTWAAGAATVSVHHASRSVRFLERNQEDPVKLARLLPPMALYAQQHPSVTAEVVEAQGVPLLVELADRYHTHTEARSNGQRIWNAVGMLLLGVARQHPDALTPTQAERLAILSWARAGSAPRIGSSAPSPQQADLSSPASPGSSPSRPMDNSASRWCVALLSIYFAARPDALLAGPALGRFIAAHEEHYSHWQQTGDGAAAAGTSQENVARWLSVALCAVAADDCAIEAAANRPAVVTACVACVGAASRALLAQLPLQSSADGGSSQAPSAASTPRLASARLQSPACLLDALTALEIILEVDEEVDFRRLRQLPPPGPALLPPLAAVAACAVQTLAHFAAEGRKVAPGLAMGRMPQAVAILSSLLSRLSRSAACHPHLLAAIAPHVSASHVASSLSELARSSNTAAGTGGPSRGDGPAAPFELLAPLADDLVDCVEYAQHAWLPLHIAAAGLMELMVANGALAGATRRACGSLARRLCALDGVLRFAAAAADGQTRHRSSVSVLSSLGSRRRSSSTAPAVQDPVGLSMTAALLWSRVLLAVARGSDSASARDVLGVCAAISVLAEAGAAGVATSTIPQNSPSAAKSTPVADAATGLCLVLHSHLRELCLLIRPEDMDANAAATAVFRVIATLVARALTARHAATDGFARAQAMLASAEELAADLCGRTLCTAPAGGVRELLCEFLIKTVFPAILRESTEAIASTEALSPRPSVTGATDTPRPAGDVPEACDESPLLLRRRRDGDGGEATADTDSEFNLLSSETFTLRSTAATLATISRERPIFTHERLLAPLGALSRLLLAATIDGGLAPQSTAGLCQAVAQALERMAACHAPAREALPWLSTTAARCFGAAALLPPAEVGSTGVLTTCQSFVVAAMRTPVEVPAWLGWDVVASVSTCIAHALDSRPDLAATRHAQQRHPHLDSLLLLVMRHTAWRQDALQAEAAAGDVLPAAVVGGIPTDAQFAALLEACAASLAGAPLPPVYAEHPLIQMGTTFAGSATKSLLSAPCQEFFQAMGAHPEAEGGSTLLTAAARIVALEATVQDLQRRLAAHDRASDSVSLPSAVDPATRTENAPSQPMDAPATVSAFPACEVLLRAASEDPASPPMISIAFLVTHVTDEKDPVSGGAVECAPLPAVPPPMLVPPPAVHDGSTMTEQVEDGRVVALAAVLEEEVMARAAVASAAGLALAADSIAWALGMAREADAALNRAHSRRATAEAEVERRDQAARLCLTEGDARLLLAAKEHSELTHVVQSQHAALLSLTAAHLGSLRSSPPETTDAASNTVLRFYRDASCATTVVSHSAGTMTVDVPHPPRAPSVSADESTDDPDAAVNDNTLRHIRYCLGKGHYAALEEIALVMMKAQKSSTRRAARFQAEADAAARTIWEQRQTIIALGEDLDGLRRHADGYTAAVSDSDALRTRFEQLDRAFEKLASALDDVDSEGAPLASATEGRPVPHGEEGFLRERAYKRMAVRVKALDQRLRRLQRDYAACDDARVLACVEGVEARKALRHTEILKENNVRGMDWARLRMDRMERERRAAEASHVRVEEQLSEAATAAATRAASAEAEFSCFRDACSDRVERIDTELAVARQKVQRQEQSILHQEALVHRLQHRADSLVAARGHEGKISRPASAARSRSAAISESRVLCDRGSRSMISAVPSSPRPVTPSPNGRRARGEGGAEVHTKSYLAWKRITGQSAAKGYTDPTARD